MEISLLLINNHLKLKIMFYKKLFIWLFWLIIGVFTGCLPILLFVLAYFPMKHWSIEEEKRKTIKDINRLSRYYTGIRKNKERNG